MSKIIKSSAWSGLSVVMRAVASLAINKLFAVMYGPNGITLLAHFQNLLSILSTIPNGGINVGLIKYLAPEKENSEAYGHYFRAALVLNLIAVAVGMAVLFASREFYFGVFVSQTTPGTEWRWYLAFFAGAFLLIMNMLLINVLLARDRLPYYVLITIVSALLGVLAVWLVMEKMSVGATLIAFLWGQAIWFFASLVFVFRFRLIPALGNLRVPKPYFADLGKFILMSVSTLVFMKLVDFFVRDYVITRFDLYQTGLWQSVAKISDNYTLFYTSLMGMVYYTHLAGLLPDPEQMRVFVRRAFYVVVPIVGGGLLVFYLFSDFFISLLYAREFLEARYLLDYQLIGDFFKLSSYVLSAIVSVQANVRLYLWSQGLSGLFYVVVLALLIQFMGLEGATLAHAIRYGGFWLFHVLYFRKLIF